MIDIYDNGLQYFYLHQVEKTIKFQGVTYILFINACFITKNRKNKRVTNRNKEEECVHIFIYGRLKNLHIVYRHAFLNQDTTYRTLLAFLTARAATHKNTRHKTKIYKVVFQENRCVSHKQVKYQN